MAANGRGGECEEEIRVVDRGLVPLVWMIRKVGCERRVDWECREGRGNDSVWL